MFKLINMKKIDTKYNQEFLCNFNFIKNRKDINKQKINILYYLEHMDLSMFTNDSIYIVNNDEELEVLLDYFYNNKDFLEVL